jgi:hypothetical protein
MATSCPHADIFGKPGTGAHALRVPFPGTPDGVAAVDLAMTAAAAGLAAYALDGGWLLFLLVFVCLMLAGVIAHRAFCVDSALNVLLFGKRRPAAPPDEKLPADADALAAAV